MKSALCVIFCIIAAICSLDWMFTHAETSIHQVTQGIYLLAAILAWGIAALIAVMPNTSGILVRMEICEAELRELNKAFLRMEQWQSRSDGLLEAIEKNTR